jgi:hypothetical protein
MTRAKKRHSFAQSLLSMLVSKNRLHGHGYLIRILFRHCLGKSGDRVCFSKLLCSSFSPSGFLSSHSVARYFLSLPAYFSLFISVFLANVIRFCRLAASFRMLLSLFLALPGLLTAANAAAINARAADICGARGYDKSTSYNYDGSGAYANLSACGARCQADNTRCNSFAFGGTECLLYTNTVVNNLNADASSPYLFYDVGCVGTASTSTTVPTSATSPGSSTTAMTSSTSTVPTTSSPPSPTSSQTCGVAGYDLGTAAYSFDGSGTNGNLNACSALCLADSKCLGFAFGSGDCLLYSVPASSNLYPLSTSPFLFYDKSCVASPTSTSTSSTATTSTTTTAAPTQTFCLQITGSGPPGKGYYAYSPPNPSGSPGIYFTSDATNTNSTLLFNTSTPTGTFLWDITGNRVEFLDRLTNPSPSPVQPLIRVSTLTPGDQEDYQMLSCSIGQTENLQCTVGAQGLMWNQFAVTDASFKTDQMLYTQTSTGGMDQVGLTVVDQSLCPGVPVANP